MNFQIVAVHRVVLVLPSWSVHNEGRLAAAAYRVDSIVFVASFVAFLRIINVRLVHVDSYGARCTIAAVMACVVGATIMRPRMQCARHAVVCKKGIGMSGDLLAPVAAKARVFFDRLRIQRARSRRMHRMVEARWGGPDFSIRIRIFRMADRCRRTGGARSRRRA